MNLMLVYQWVIDTCTMVSAIMPSLVRMPVALSRCSRTNTPFIVVCWPCLALPLCCCFAHLSFEVLSKNLSCSLWYRAIWRRKSQHKGSFLLAVIHLSFLSETPARSSVWYIVKKWTDMKQWVFNKVSNSSKNQSGCCCHDCEFSDCLIYTRALRQTEARGCDRAKGFTLKAEEQSESDQQRDWIWGPQVSTRAIYKERENWWSKQYSSEWRLITKQTEQSGSRRKSVGKLSTMHERMWGLADWSAGQSIEHCRTQ